MTRATIPIRFREADFEAVFVRRSDGRVRALTRLSIPAPFIPERTRLAARAVFDLLAAAETLNVFLAEPPGGLGLDDLIASQSDWPDSQISVLAQAARAAEATPVPGDPGSLPTAERVSPAERVSLFGQPEKETSDGVS